MRLSVLVVVLGLSAAALAASVDPETRKSTPETAGQHRRGRFFLLTKLVAGGAALAGKAISSVSSAISGIGKTEITSETSQPILILSQPQQQSSHVGYPPAPSGYPPHPPATTSKPKPKQPCPIVGLPTGCVSGQVCTSAGYGKHECAPKRPAGAPCATSFECRSGTCREGYCRADECRDVGLESTCKWGQECVDTYAGNKCEKKGRVDQCPTVLTSKGCGEMEFCTEGYYGNVCANKRPVNADCIESVQCLAGSCRHGKCKNDWCPMPDTSDDCEITEYCATSKSGNQCRERKGNGERCSSSGQCMSGVCEHAVCVEDQCWKSLTQDRCQMTHFCSPGPKGNTCDMKGSDGAACREDVMCQSNLCRERICMSDECGTVLTTDRCDASMQFCKSTRTGYKCTTKLMDGNPCKTPTMCMSGNCEEGMCQPKTPKKMKNHHPCDMNSECESHLCVAKKCRTALLSQGGKCYKDSDCQSLMCIDRACGTATTTTTEAATTANSTTTT